uniref:Leucine-rich repeat and IQ domain-containing protein 3 n=1 Tax=Lygus hesperus TaxID=30085 RepID=A0A0A9WJ05_LYGHE
MANGVAVASSDFSSNNNRNTPNTKSTPLPLTAAALRFKHKAALHELDKKSETLRKVQREVEERRRMRLEKVREQHSLQKISNSNNSHDSSVVHDNGSTTTTRGVSDHRNLTPGDTPNAPRPINAIMTAAEAAMRGLPCTSQSSSQ